MGASFNEPQQVIIAVETVEKASVWLIPVIVASITAFGGIIVAFVKRKR